MKRALPLILGLLLLTVPMAALAGHNPGHEKRAAQADVAERGPQAGAPDLSHEDDASGEPGVHVNPHSGSQRSVNAKADIQDDNGHNDIQTAECTVKAPDGTVHIPAFAATKANGNGAQAQFDCAFQMDYHDDPGNYTVEINVTDRDGRSSASNATFVYEELAASSLNTQTIDLSTEEGDGALTPGNDTFDAPTKVTLSNTGNIPIDLQYSGTDLTDGPSAIKITNLYMKTDGTSDFSTDKLPFSTQTQQDASFDLQPGLDSTRDLYFALDVPENLPSGTYTGEATLEAISGS